jgi:phosphatidate cytidylyltransferase
MATRRNAPSQRRRSNRARRRNTGSDLLARVLVAVPAAAFAIAIVYFGGAIFALGVLALGLVCLHELFDMLAPMRPLRLAGFLGLCGLVAAAGLGGDRQVLFAASALLPVLFALAVAAPLRDRVTLGLAATVFGVYWIGLGFAHAVLLRGLDHGGALVFLVLLGTFLGDTGAYLGGRLLGTTPLAPRISPNKTWEGLGFGVFTTVLVIWYASRTYTGTWISGIDGLLLGVAVAVAAPLGDLFESLVKRDVGAKDAGRLFGVHGGALDRLDAVIFSVIAGYHVWLVAM